MLRTKQQESGSIETADAVFGVYHYPKGDKYWECLPIEEENGVPLYRIRWWLGSEPPSPTREYTSTVMVERKEALRRIESVKRGGYVLHSSPVAGKPHSLLEWMSD